MQTIHIEKEMEWSVYKHRSLSLPIEIKETTEHVSRTSQTSRQMEMNKEVICVKHCQDNMRKNVNRTLVQALKLCTGRTVHRVSTDIDILFHDHGTRSGWRVSVTPWPLFTPGKDPVPNVQEDWWAPWLVLTGVENLASTGIRSPDRPARNQSLYRLSYRAH
jgi:hypothetical protein